MAKHISLLLFRIWLYSKCCERRAQKQSFHLSACWQIHSCVAPMLTHIPLCLLYSGGRQKARPCKQFIKNWHRFFSLEYSAYFSMYFHSYFFPCQRDCLHKVWSNSTSYQEGLKFHPKACSGFVFCVYFRRAKLQSWKKPNSHVPSFPTRIPLFHVTSS